MQLENMGLHGLTIEFKTLTSVNFNLSPAVHSIVARGFLRWSINFAAILNMVAQGHERQQEWERKGREAVP